MSNQIKNNIKMPVTRHFRKRNKWLQFKEYFKRNYIPVIGGLLLWLYSVKEDKYHSIRMISRLRSLSVNCGTKFTVLYLKESHRLLMKALAGEPCKSNDCPRVATRWGFPLIIPGALRRKIYLQRDADTTRLVLSILTIYRGLKYDADPKLNTITDVFSGSTKTLPFFEINRCLRELSAQRRWNLRPSGHILPSVSAGPNGQHACLSLSWDAWAIQTYWSELLPHFKTISDLTGPTVYQTLMSEIEELPSFIQSLDHAGKLSQADLKLGKLGTKNEGAGKVRIFAITDIWTQSVLKPLHDAIFGILRPLEQDGTFDQLAPIRRLYDRKHQKLWSFDLSAATDRLPVDLQEQVLACLTNDEFARAWKLLLTSRPWFFKGVPIVYSVGQPMGALSSWGMMALTDRKSVV